MDGSQPRRGRGRVPLSSSRSQHEPLASVKLDRPAREVFMMQPKMTGGGGVGGGGGREEEGGSEEGAPLTD